ncbi:MAG: hypothetical protein FH753_11180 [Firmicutes bacterium]|nr:hypothetical protein [Bacillota bacterium]
MKYFLEIIEEKNINVDIKVNIDIPIENLEKVSPIISLNYNEENTCEVFVCRHFMYYGKKGNSFNDFKESILKYLQYNI